MRSQSLLENYTRRVLHLLSDTGLLFIILAFSITCIDMYKAINHITLMHGHLSIMFKLDHKANISILSFDITNRVLTYFRTTKVFKHEIAT